ncbi:MAG TPA: sensor histidine kinase N-terminal domain-containing protein [Rhodocyclaceae bacterium]
MNPTQATKRGLQQRLLLWIIPPLVLLVIVSVLSDFQLARDPARDAYDSALLDGALAVAAHLRSDRDGLHLELSQQAEGVLRTDEKDRIYFAVFDRRGQRIAGDPGLVWRSENGRQAYYLDDTVDGKSVRVVVYRATVGAVEAQVQVAETTHKRELLTQRVLAALIAPNLLLIVAAAVMIAFGVNAGLAPLRTLRSQIESRSPRDLRPLPLDRVPAEIEPLVESLNRLFALLTGQVAAQQRFLANAAHQLKTPLSALQTQIELAASDGDLGSVQARLGKLEVATLRLGHLLQQLLALAKAEPSASLTAQYRELDLKTVIEAMVADYPQLAIDKRMDLGFELASATIRGIPWLIHELVANLLDNALRYAGDGDTVTVRCGLAAGHPFIEVEDNGPGIPEAERQRVFERFYRPAGTLPEGCGLGLAIVREICEAHGATVAVTPGGDGRGALFRVDFPPQAMTA